MWCHCLIYSIFLFVILFTSKPGNDQDLSVTEDESASYLRHSVCIPGYNGSVRSLTHINSIFNRQKLFSSHSASVIPERPSTISHAFSARLGVNRARKRLSEVYVKEQHNYLTRNNRNMRHSFMEIKTEEMMPYSTYYVPKGDYSRSNSSLNYNFDEMDTSFNEMDKLTKSLSRIEDKEAALNRTKSLDQSIFQLSGTCKDTNFTSNQVKKFSPSRSKLPLATSLSQIKEERYMTIANDNDSIFICVIPYQGRHPEELSMKKGEIIEGFQLVCLTFFA